MKLAEPDALLEDVAQARAKANQVGAIDGGLAELKAPGDDEQPNPAGRPFLPPLAATMDNEEQQHKEKQRLGLFTEK